jgi:hypothetical protein
MTRFVAALAISLSFATPSFAADTLADASRRGKRARQGSAGALAALPRT